MLPGFAIRERDRSLRAWAVPRHLSAYSERSLHVLYRILGAGGIIGGLALMFVELRHAMSGNLCRCGAYVKILKAGARAAELLGNKDPKSNHAETDQNQG